MNGRRILPAAAVVVGALALASCQSAKPETGGKSAALRAMEHVATAAHRCWVASGDAAFADVSFANELDSYSGRPRFLLVPKKNYGGKPLLVVQAEGAAGKVSAFGPMMDGPNGKRIAADVTRWAGGGESCEATA